MFFNALLVHPMGDSSNIGDGLLNIAMAYGELPDIDTLSMAEGLF